MFAWGRRQTFRGDGSDRFTCAYSHQTSRLKDGVFHSRSRYFCQPIYQYTFAEISDSWSCGDIVLLEIKEMLLNTLITDFILVYHHARCLASGWLHCTAYMHWALHLCTGHCVYALVAGTMREKVFKRKIIKYFIV